VPGRERHRLGSTTFAALFACACALVVTSVPRKARADDPDPWLGRDKLEHFLATDALASGTYTLTVTRVPARWQALALGAGMALGVGAAKEGWDALGHGDPSWRDFAWDAIGTVCGLGLAWGIDLLVRGVDDAHPLFRTPSLRF
jgi:putative lipoprotein